MMPVNCSWYTVTVSVHWRICMVSNSRDNYIEYMEEVSHSVINPCTFFCLRKGSKRIVTETLTYLVFNSILSHWRLVKELKMCLALGVVANLFLGLCLLLTRKGHEVYLSSQKFVSCELQYSNLLKMLVESFFVGFFLFCIWEPDHAFKWS